MSNTNQDKCATRLLLFFTLAFGFLMGCERRPPVAGEEQVRRLVEEALPAWDSGVLDVRDGVDWSAELSIGRIFQAARDTAPRVQAEVMEQALRLEDGERAVRLDKSLGKARYVNRARAWQYSDRAAQAVDEQRARAVVLEAVRALGVPEAEIAASEVATQAAAGAPVDSDTIQDRFDMYRIISVSRAVNELPVHGSSARGAVSNAGAIQRLQVNWPTFRISALQLRQREAVVREVVDQIMSQDPDPNVRVEASLAYAPRAQGDEEVSYVPVAVISVYAAPTPYQILVPLAE